MPGKSRSRRSENGSRAAAPPTSRRAPCLVEILRLIGKQELAGLERMQEARARGASPKNVGQIEQDTFRWYKIQFLVCGRVHEATGLRRSHITASIARLGSGDDFDGKVPADSCATYGDMLLDWAAAYDEDKPGPDKWKADLRHVPSRLRELDNDGTTEAIWAELIERWPFVQVVLDRSSQANHARLASDSAVREEWMPAGKAVNKAASLGLRITLSRLSKLIQENKVPGRDPQLPGRHFIEVEFNSLLAFLAREQGESNSAGNAAGDKEPSPEERQKLDEDIQAARARKRLERPTN